jgi:hypothetical protein
MASALYPKYKQLILGAGLNLTSLNIKAVVVDGADYTYSAAHDNLDDVPSGARIATSGNLASKTVTDGVFDAADVVINSVAGDASEIVIIYYDSGTESTSTLIAYIDGLTIQSNPGNLTIQWHASGIFAL